MDLITTTDALARLCEGLASDPYVTVDTEFMRETTYWPELCLIQMAGSELNGLIDPLAPGIDLAPFFALMNDGRGHAIVRSARMAVPCARRGTAMNVIAPNVRMFPELVL